MISNPEESIPIVDLSSFAPGGSPKDRKRASQQLFEACSVLGFVNIIGHGMSDTAIDEAFTWSKRLFDLPHEEKMKAPHPVGPVPHRGYSAPGVEKVYSKNDLDSSEANGEQGASLRKIQDFKESYEVGSEDNPAQPNIWLPEQVLPGYRDFATTLYWELNKAAQRVLAALCLGLNLTNEESNRMVKLHSGHNNQLRLLHYPPIEAEKLAQKVVGRMPAHQDWSSFTMLFQDTCGGLELQDPRRPGTFVPAKPIPGVAILNVGDMLQRFTNGIFPSAMHQVTMPPVDSSTKTKDDGGVTRARYSIPYFVAPDHESVVECLPSCVTADRPSKYKPVRWCDYGEYMAKYAYKNGEKKEE